MKLIAVVTPELVEACADLYAALPDNPIAEFLSHVNAGDMIVSHPPGDRPNN